MKENDKTFTFHCHIGGDGYEYNNDWDQEVKVTFVDGLDDYDIDQADFVEATKKFLKEQLECDSVQTAQERVEEEAHWDEEAKKL